MTANDWLIIEKARARREGVRTGMFLTAPIAIALGIVVMFAVHVGLSMYAERKHDEVVRLLNQDLDMCTATVARYVEVAAVEKAYAERRSE